MLPNFIVAGVAKGGTTSLYYYLSQHPEIEIPRKETFFFAQNFFENMPSDGLPYFRQKSRIFFDEKKYNKLYVKCNNKAVGEVSTCYCYFHKDSIPLIKEKLGDIKIIFILRNPVERAFSAYKHFFLRHRCEPLSFNEAIRQEKIRMQKHWDFMWYYTDMGFYAEAIKQFKKNFSNVKIFLAEELANKPQWVMKEIFQFIGVKDSFAVDTGFRYNISSSQEASWFALLYRNPVFSRFINPIIKKIIPEKKRFAIKHNVRKPLISSGLTFDELTRQELVNLFRTDILELEKITNKNLSNWLK